MPHPDDHEKPYVLTKLEGNVLGYEKGSNQRPTLPVKPALVYLKIHILKDGKKDVWFDLYDKKGLEELRAQYPQVYEAVAEHVQSFTVQKVGDSGEFTFDKIPVGWWCYEVHARVERNDYNHTEKQGDDGTGNRKRINKEVTQGKPDLEGIVVPVPEKKGTIAGVKKDDKHAKPEERVFDDLEEMKKVRKKSHTD